MRTLPLLLAALALLAGCDFTTALDIDVPEHEPRAVVDGVLAVDSVAVVRLGRSNSPYRVTRDGRFYRPETPTDAVVTLLRDGQAVETLAVRSETCEDFDNRTGRPAGSYECGPFAGAVPLEAGATYTVRAETPGLPAAEATVTMPRPPDVTAAELEPVEDQGRDRRRFRVEVRDAPGRGDRYGVSLLSGPTERTLTTCDPPDYTTCRDSTFIDPGRRTVWFDSSDPLILAAERSVLDDFGTRFASVPDDTFDGRTWTFTLTTAGYDYYGGGGSAVTVQVAALTGDLYEVYLTDRFGNDGDDNPFAEPTNRPSNVDGGFGLVGGIALAEVTFGPPE